MIYYFDKKQRTTPTVCHCGKDEKLKPGIVYGPIVRDIYIFESCTGGKGSIVVNDKEFPVKEGDCYFLMPGDKVIHKADNKEPRTGFYCAVDGLVIGEALSDAGIDSKNPFAPPELYGAITNELVKIFDLRNDKTAGAEYKMTACIYNILGIILNSTSKNSNKADFVVKAIGIMEARYFTDLSIRAIADEIGLDRCYFSTVFKNQTRLSPYEYLTSLRIRKACEQFNLGYNSVAETAFSVGIEPRNFSRLFKKEIGMTPLEYIKKLNV